MKLKNISQKTVRTTVTSFWTILKSI